MLGDAFTDLCQNSGPFCHPPAGLLVSLLGLVEKKVCYVEISSVTRAASKMSMSRCRNSQTPQVIRKQASSDWNGAACQCIIVCSGPRLPRWACPGRCGTPGSDVPAGCWCISLCCSPSPGSFWCPPAVCPGNSATTQQWMNRDKHLFTLSICY